MRRAVAVSMAAIARGVAVFFGGFSLANAVSLAFSGRSEDLWWIDTRFLPPWLGAVVMLLAAVFLVAFGLVPRMATWRRHATVLACAVLAGLALVNVEQFYRFASAGAVRPAMPLPLSLPIALTFLLLGAGLLVRPRDEPPRAAPLVALVALCSVATFPLAQIAFFGTSDYRAPADAVVVFGAKAFPSGYLSVSLDDRVRTAVHLYEEGLVRRLIMSGGIDPRGVDEAASMKARAVALGVPAEAIVMDTQGVDTDATVRNTRRILAEQGADRVLVVSQQYHLPRIKMAYRAAGLEVRTVPAEKSRPIKGTPWYVAREVPAFWSYWLRALIRDVA